MRRVMFGSAVVVATMIGVVLVPGLASPAGPRPMRPGPVPSVVPLDTGAGERLVVVLGGTYATEDEALAAQASMGFGDLQGYYVVPVEQFLGLAEQVGIDHAYALVSVFRTEAGAKEFLSLAQARDVPALRLPTRVRSLGGRYAGLGQEPSPDGSGPLVAPVAESAP